MIKPLSVFVLLYRVVQGAVICIDTVFEPCSEEELDDLGIRDELQEALSIVNNTCTDELDWDVSMLNWKNSLHIYQYHIYVLYLVWVMASCRTNDKVLPESTYHLGCQKAVTSPQWYIWYIYVCLYMIMKHIPFVLNPVFSFANDVTILLNKICLEELIFLGGLYIWTPPLKRHETNCAFLALARDRRNWPMKFCLGKRYVEYMSFCPDWEFNTALRQEPKVKGNLCWISPYGLYIL